MHLHFRLLDSSHCNALKQLIIGTSASQFAKQMYLNKLKSRCLCVLCALYFLNSSLCNSLSRLAVTASKPQTL